MSVCEHTQVAHNPTRHFSAIKKESTIVAVVCDELTGMQLAVEFGKLQGRGGGHNNSYYAKLRKY
jgi:hypothetical protein